MSECVKILSLSACFYLSLLNHASRASSQPYFNYWLLSSIKISNFRAQTVIKKEKTLDWMLWMSFFVVDLSETECTHARAPICVFAKCETLANSGWYISGNLASDATSPFFFFIRTKCTCTTHVCRICSTFQCLVCSSHFAALNHHLSIAQTNIENPFFSFLLSVSQCVAYPSC